MSIFVDFWCRWGPSGVTFWLDVGEPRGRRAKRTENSAGRAAKRSDQERQRDHWDFGASKESVLRLGGGLGVRLGTLWGTLGGFGTTFELQGSQKSCFFETLFFEFEKTCFF